MEKTAFVHVTYVATSPEKVWEAIVVATTTAKYRQNVNVSDWKPGSEMKRGITEGWPMVLSSLKTFPETGRPLPKLW